MGQFLRITLEARLDWVVLGLLAWLATWNRLRAARARTGKVVRRPCLWAVVAILVGLGGFLAEQFGNWEKRRLQTMMEGYAPLYAAEFTRLGHERVGPATSPDDPTYLALIDAQKRWLALNPAVHDIYTFRRSADGRALLIVDSETDYDADGVYRGGREARTRIGQEYDVDDVMSASLDAALAGMTDFDDQPYADEWGVWVSCLTPIYDADGSIGAALGVDFDAQEWIAAVLFHRAFALAAFAILIGMAIAACLSVELAQARVAEKMLAERNEILERSNRELANANERALAGARAKGQFLANMSHEIRTPMTAILGLTELLEDHQTSAQERTDCLRTIRSSGDHLLSLIDDILDFSKLEAGRLRIRVEPTSPWTVLSEAALLLRDRADAKRLEFVVQRTDGLPETIQSDPVRLRQIVLNLVSNAIKFTDHGTVRIVVKPAMLERHGDAIAVEVTDTGIGIDDVARQRLFEPFEQGNATLTRNAGGTGLGLSITRRIVELMGGRIEASSEVGVGSCFVAVIPVQCSAQVTPPSGEDGTSGIFRAYERPLATRAASQAAQSDRSAVGSSAPATTSLQTKVECDPPGPSLDALSVLLVEDTPDTRRVMEFKLRKAGVQVVLAENGAEAVATMERADAPPIDLILMDMQMPVLDGYAATRELRRLGHRQRIVAVTAHTQIGDRERCLAAGCDDYMTKPVRQDVLLAALTAAREHRTSAPTHT
ncbi:MAG: ATP-binding protein [Planctomycetota bacterium]